MVWCMVSVRKWYGSLEAAEKASLSRKYIVQIAVKGIGSNPSWTVSFLWLQDTCDTSAIYGYQLEGTRCQSSDSSSVCWHLGILTILIHWLASGQSHPTLCGMVSLHLRIHTSKPWGRQTFLLFTHEADFSTVFARFKLTPCTNVASKAFKTGDSHHSKLWPHHIHGSSQRMQVYHCNYCQYSQLR